MDGQELLTRLRAGAPVRALGIRASRHPDIARWAKAAGYDCLWVDMEHSPMSADVAAHICSTAADLGLLPLVRPPERDYGAINRLLDGGALGIIAARIESAAQARDVVTATKFAPLGQRSQVSTLPCVGFAALPAGELNARVNHATLVQVLIESGAGVAAADGIAAVDGVDMVGVGCNDLSADLGHPGQASHPDVVAACRAILAAGRRHGKVVVIGGMPEGEALAALRREGAAPFLFGGIDTDLFIGALRQKIISMQSIATA